MKTTSTLAILCAVTAATLALGTTAFADKSPFSSKDKTFIENASEAGHSEIDQAKLADKNSSNAKVKEFADMMIKDHTEAGDKLEKIVTGKGGNVEKSSGTMQKADYLMLKAKSGDSFDKAYAKQAVEDHQKAVALFEKASTDSDDAELKAFAEKTLPTLKHHLKAAEDLQASLGK